MRAIIINQRLKRTLIVLSQGNRGGAVNMNTTIGTFLTVAMTSLVLTAFLIGIAFDALEGKHDIHQQKMENVHQIQSK